MNLTVKSLMEEVNKLNNDILPYSIKINSLESEKNKLISELDMLQNKYNELDLQSSYLHFFLLVLFKAEICLI